MSINLPTATPACDLRSGDEFTRGDRFYTVRGTTDHSHLGLELVEVRTDAETLYVSFHEIVGDTENRLDDARRILERRHNERTH